MNLDYIDELEAIKLISWWNAAMWFELVCEVNLKLSSNIVEISCSGLLMLWLIFQFSMQVKLHMRISFGWQQVLLVLIFLCLAFCICFALWGNIIVWYVMKSFIYQVYFTTLVYFFTMKYCEKKVAFDQRKPYIVCLMIAYVIFCLAELGSFITLVNQGVGRCKQIAQIIIDALMISLGVIFFYLAYRNQTQQRKKFEEFKVSKQSVNPLRDIWVWVSMNIIGQIFNLVQSCLIYSIYGHEACTPVQGKSSIQSSILSIVFFSFTYLISFSSTLWFYHQKRISQQYRGQLLLTTLQLSSAQADTENKIEILKFSSIGESSLHSAIVGQKVL